MIDMCCIYSFMNIDIIQKTVSPKLSYYPEVDRLLATGGVLLRLTRLAGVTIVTNSRFSPSTQPGHGSVARAGGVM